MENEFRATPWLDFLGFVLESALTFACVGAIVNRSDLSLFGNVPLWLVAAGGLPFFAAGAAFFLIRMLDDRPRIRVTSDAFEIGPGVVTSGLRLKWEEIASVDAGPVGNVNIWLCRPKEVEERVGPLARMTMRLSRASGHAPVSIGTLGLPITVRELRDGLRNRIAEVELGQIRKAATTHLEP